MLAFRFFIYLILEGIESRIHLFSTMGIRGTVASRVLFEIGSHVSVSVFALPLREQFGCEIPTFIILKHSYQ